MPLTVRIFTGAHVMPELNALKWLLPTALLVLGVSGCATTHQGAGLQDDNILESGFGIGQGARTERAIPTPIGQRDQVMEPRSQRERVAIYRGEDPMTQVAEARPELRLHESGEEVSLDFEQAPLQDVVHALLGDLLDLNYSIESPLEGEVTLRTSAPVPKEGLLDILESLLMANGATLREDVAGVYRVTSLEMVGGAGGLYRQDELPPGHATVIAPLRHIDASEMASVLSSVAPEGAILRVDKSRNLLLLRGSRRQLQGWFHMIDSFDVDHLSGMSMALFSLEHATVSEARDALQLMLQGDISESTSSSNQDGPVEPLSGLVRVLPIKRLNSLLVVTPRASYLDLVKRWIDRIDRPMDNDLAPRLYVYPVQNGNASHLAGLLKALYGQDARGDDPERRPEADSGVAPGLDIAQMRTSANQGSNRSAENPEAPTPATLPEAGAGGFAITAQGLGGEVRVVADEHNNALLIYAPRRHYERIKDALKQLDRTPSQVLIEASIIEVTLRDELEFGLEWFLQNSASGYQGSGRLNLNATGGIGPRQPGFSYSIANPQNQIRAVFNALASDSLLRVLSNPSILALDNHTASIHVGDQQPVRSARSQTDGGLTTETIEYRDTGIMLSVTPSINAGGLVSMNITQSVTDVGEQDDATGQRVFLQREVRSRVSVRSGETVVLGGLIRDNRSDGSRGLPGLHQVPLMGALFGRTTRSASRTELLVMITPRVLESDVELREVSDEMRQRLRGLKLQERGDRRELDAL